MKKSGTKSAWRCLVMGGLLAAGVLAGCSRGTGGAVKEIQSRGVFRAAVCDTSSLARGENGSYSGEEPELIKKIGDALSVETEYLPAADQAAAEAMVQDGTADVAVGMIQKSGGAGEGLALSVPYGSDSYYVMTRRGDYSNSPLAFAGRNLGVAPADTSILSGMGSGTDAPVTRVLASGGEAAAALKSGAIDGYVCRLEEAVRLSGADEALQFQNLLNVEKAEYVLAVREKEDTLLRGINTIISDALLEAAGLQESAADGLQETK